MWDEARSQSIGWRTGEFWSTSHDVAIGLYGLLTKGRTGPDSLVVAKASSKLSCFAIVFSLTSLLVVMVIWVVLAGVLWVITSLLALLKYNFLLRFLKNALPLGSVLRIMAFLVPQSVLLFLRFWAYKDQDDVFIAALRQERLGKTPQERQRLHRLAHILAVLPAASTLQWLKRYVATVLKNAVMAVLMLSVASLPGVGPLVLPTALALQRHLRVGVVPTMLLFAISLLPAGSYWPSGRTLSLYGLQLLLMAKSVSKELLYTMLGRSSAAQRRALAGRHQARVLGLGLVAGAVLSVPLLGALLWFDLVKLAAEVLSSAVLEDEAGALDLEPAMAKFEAERARQRARSEAEEDRRAALERARSEE